MNKPLTLAEFARGLDLVKTYDGGGNAVVKLRNLQRLILRLLAGERERCANTLMTFAGKPDFMGRVFYQEEEKAAGYGSIIRNMGDPQP